MKIAVYAKTGKISQNRWIRLTGVQNKDGAYECDAVGPSKRAHAIVVDTPSGEITPTVHGYAETLGLLVYADASSAIGPDRDASTNPDGTVSAAKKGDYTVGVSIGPAAKGKKALLMMRWGTRP